MGRVAIFITNYNMPERTNALCKHIRKHVCWPYDLFVVDNGSDLVPPSQYTTRRLEKNVQTTGGWLEGLKAAKESGMEYFAYWFLITSAEFVLNSGDVLTPLASFLVDKPEAVGVHPALTLDSSTAWKHLIARNGGGYRRTWMIDNIASLWRAEWFDANGGFDPELVYGWGIDLELCWKARVEGRSLWVCEDTQVKKVTDIGYAMERMNMSADDRRRLAGENMSDVLSRRYGPAWQRVMWETGVTDGMK